MHPLNSAHIGLAIMAAIVFVLLCFGAYDTWRALQARRDRRAIIEPTTYESIPYKERKP